MLWFAACKQTHTNNLAYPVSSLSPLQVSITFKNQQVLQDVSWEVKKGERVGLVGECWMGSFDDRQ